MSDNIFEFEGRRPTIHPDVWIAPTATIVGDVTIGAGASVWYGAVIRADVSPIRIGERTNIQDGTIVHTGWEAPMVIGAEVTVGHGCVLHGSEIGEGSLIGNGAVLLDTVVVGARSVVAANSVVVAGTVIPDGVIAAGSPAKVLKETAGSSAEQWLQYNATFYVDLAARHAATARPI